MEKDLLRRLTNDYNRELVEFMISKGISEQVISITIIGIGSHTAYYRVLYNRLNNLKEINDEIVKKVVVGVLQDIDRAEDM